MVSDTSIDFIEEKNVSIETDRRDKYRVSVLLAIWANRWKLPSLVIVKGESGKTIENKLRNLDICQKGTIFVYFQKSVWCTNEIIEEWLKNILLPYTK